MCHVGDPLNPAVLIDGCYRSARIDAGLASRYPFDLRQAIELRKSAHDWFRQAQAIERAWLRRVAKVPRG